MVCWCRTMYSPSKQNYKAGRCHLRHGWNGGQTGTPHPPQVLGKPWMKTLNTAASNWDKDIVNKSQIRTICKSNKRKTCLPCSKTCIDKDGKFEVPNAHLRQNRQPCWRYYWYSREEFGRRKKFCKKDNLPKQKTQNSAQPVPQRLLPRIAVTVDMIATGTDIRPVGSAAVYEGCKKQKLCTSKWKAVAPVPVRWSS